MRQLEQMDFGMSEEYISANPGEQLRLLLERLYPFDAASKKSFVTMIDDALLGEGQFAELVYRSSLNYVVRRLITAADYLRRKYHDDSYPPERYITEIRHYIHDYTRIPSIQAEKIVTILLECLREGKLEPTAKTKSQIRSRARSKGDKCYICGEDIDFEQESQYNSFAVEHIWPRKMGGSSHDFNLKQACQRCTQAKADYIEASDFHYEEICLVTDESSDHFSKELRWQYRVALLAKSEYRCVVCGRPAEYFGPLQLARRDPSDSWHFLNIDVFCSQHSSR